MRGSKVSAANGKAKTPVLNKTSMVLIKSKTDKLQLKYASGTVKWSSSRPSVASVSSAGKVTARKAGKCVITAKNKGKTYRCSVTVYASYTTRRTALLENKYKKASNQGKIVLAGSSMLEYWTGYKAAFAPYDVINVGIKGTTVEDWLKLYPELIVKYKPKAVVLYVGGNNIKTRYSSGKQTAAQLQKLIKKLRAALPDVPIYYVSIHPNLKRWSAWKQTKICNQQVKQFCSKQKNTYYIDITKYCLTKKGVPDKSLLVSDGLHFNAKGYKKVWNNVIVPRVKKDLKK